MNLTQNQIKALIDEKGNARKCPECIGMGIYDDEKVRKFCKVCQGSGKSTISIPKEWVECGRCHGQGKHSQKDGDDRVYFIRTCKLCKGKGKIQKHNVGEEIEVDLDYTKFGIWSIKLKIISEIEDKQQIVEV